MHDHTIQSFHGRCKSKLKHMFSNFFSYFQNITYLSGRRFKQEKKVVATAYRDQIPRGKDYIWKEKLEIPPLPPSHLKGCKIIKFQYILQVNNIHALFHKMLRAPGCMCNSTEFTDFFAPLFYLHSVWLSCCLL